jgi:very-short-patch-repair endonuclease
VRAADPERIRFRRRLPVTQIEAARPLWDRLRDRRLTGFKFVRQEPLGRYVADLCCREAKLVVALDGGQHAESAHDQQRDAWLITQGYRVRRFWNAEAVNNIIGVPDTILAALPASARKRGEGRNTNDRIPSRPHPRRRA